MWRKFIGRYNLCRARQEDKVVYHIGRDEPVAELDDEETEMLKNIVKQCSMPFDF